MRGKVGRAALAGALALGIASCGGSSALSRAELVKQANAICKRRQASIEAIGKRGIKDPAIAYAAFVPVAEKAVSKLAALKPPKELATSYGQFVAGERAEVAHIKRVITALKAHQRPPQDENVSAIHRRGALVRELGIDACT